MESLGTILRDLRRKAHISQKELADKISLRFVELCKIENGSQLATERQLRAIAPILDVPADLLVLASRAPKQLTSFDKAMKDCDQRGEVTDSMREEWMEGNYPNPRGYLGDINGPGCDPDVP